jgi:hypothetical protein
MRLIEGAQALAVATPQDVMVISNASSVLVIGLHEASYLLAGAGDLLHSFIITRYAIVAAMRSITHMVGK